LIAKPGSDEAVDQEVETAVEDKQEVGDWRDDEHPGGIPRSPPLKLTLHVPQGSRHIKLFVEDKEELEAVAEEENGDDGDEKVGEVLLSSLARSARGPECLISDRVDDAEVERKEKKKRSQHCDKDFHILLVHLAIEGVLGQLNVEISSRRDFQELGEVESKAEKQSGKKINCHPPTTSHP